jgi:glycosyltransferase involved in cell wall biosynthesis
MPFYKNRLNVIFLSDTLKIGGAEKVIKTLALNIGNYGFTPRVVCLHQPGEIGLELDRLGIKVTSNIIKGDLDILSLFRLVRLLRMDRGSILFSLDHHNSIFLGAIASVLAGIKYRVVAMHSTGLWHRKSKFKLSDRLVFPLYNRIIGLAESHIEYLRDTEGLPEDKIVAINNGIDTETFRPPISIREKNELKDALSLPKDDFIVTMIAVLRPEKNHRLLLRTAARIMKLYDNITFLIVGEGQEAANLHNIASELGINKYVRFLGMRDDVPEIIRASDVSVLCSYPVVETFPMSVLESFSSGVPVIATSVGSIPEMIDDGEDGILIESDDESGLAEALLFLYNHQGVRQEMGKKGRIKVAGRYSRKRMVEAYVEMFNQLVSRESN